MNTKTFLTIICIMAITAGGNAQQQAVTFTKKYTYTEYFSDDTVPRTLYTNPNMQILIPHFLSDTEATFIDKGSKSVFIVLADNNRFTDYEHYEHAEIKKINVNKTGEYKDIQGKMGVKYLITIYSGNSDIWEYEMYVDESSTENNAFVLINGIFTLNKNCSKKIEKIKGLVLQAGYVGDEDKFIFLSAENVDETFYYNPKEMKKALKNPIKPIKFMPPLITEDEDTADEEDVTITPVDIFIPKPSQTADKGVVINGVKWATRNVDAVGTFAPTPESYGKFYQWNRKVAWSATDEEVTGWDSSLPKGTEWEKANDPSPAGWRLPTREEFESLLDEKKVSSEWTTENGVNGRKFTDKTSGNSVFFPAVDFRGGSNGWLGYAGDYGEYWSSTQSEHYSGYAYLLGFSSDNADRYVNAHSYGFSVRCVAE